MAAEAGPPAYKLTATFKVGGDGGWDYATLHRGELYVTRVTHTQVIDVSTGNVVADIGGQKRSHGVAIVPDAKRGFISDGGSGVVWIFDLKTHAILGKVPAADDADGIIYDRASNRVLVMCGDAHQLVAIAPDVNPNGGKPAATLDLGGSPEFAVSDEAGKVYVNIVDKDEVAVVDTKQMKIVARWPTAPGSKPTGMSMDRATRRLFIGCRNKKLIVMNADDGKIVADFPIGGFVDATGFRGGLVFASCGDGTLTVVREVSPDKFEACAGGSDPDWRADDGARSERPDDLPAYVGFDVSGGQQTGASAARAGSGNVQDIGGHAVGKFTRRCGRRSRRRRRS